MAEIPNLDSPGAPETTEPVAAADVSSVARGERMPRWRRIVVAVLVVLGCILAPLSVLSVWMKTTLLDTNNYVATVAPLADNSSVQNAIADRVTNTLIVNNSVDQRIVDRLPKPAQFIAPKITDALSSFVHDATLKIVQSDQFQTLWTEANRRAHAQVVALLEGKSRVGGRVQTTNGQITLDLGPMIQKVNGALESHGITAFSNAAQNASDKQIVLINSDQLKSAQSSTNLLQQLAIVLSILTVLCFAIAIWLSPHRRRTILRSGLGLALGMALLLIAFNSGRHFYLNALPHRVNRPAATAVYNQLLDALRIALRATFAFALIVVIAAWLTGPSRSATGLREGVLHLVRGQGVAGGEPSAFGAWVARNKTVLDTLTVAIGFVILVAMSAPTPLQVLLIAIIVVARRVAHRVPRTTCRADPKHELNTPEQSVLRSTPRFGRCTRRQPTRSGTVALAHRRVGR